MSTLDINGSLKVDSINIEQSNNSLTAFKVTSFTDIIDQSLINVNTVVTDVNDVPAWQTFTAGISGTLKNISLVFSNFSEPVQKNLTIYKGEGTSGEVLGQYVWNIAATDITQGLIKSPLIDLEILQNEKYTMHLNNFAGWVFSSGNLYQGGLSSFGTNLDFGFATHIFTGTVNVFRVGGGEVAISKLKIGDGSPLSQVQNGVVDIGQQPVQISTKLVTINFPNHFTNVPKLQAIVQNELPNTNNDYTVTIKSITNTSAIVSVRRLDQINNGWSENPKLLWWAYD
jgi:hypothetical protein